jgi:hypothetical protein
MKKNKLVIGRKKLHIEELYNLCCSSDIVKTDQIKEGRMSGVCSKYGRDEK